METAFISLIRKVRSGIDPSDDARLADIYSKVARLELSDANQPEIKTLLADIVISAQMYLQFLGFDPYQAVRERCLTLVANSELADPTVEFGEIWCPGDRMVAPSQEVPVV